MGPLADLGGSGEEPHLSPVPELERTVQPVTNRYVDCGIHRRDMKINYYPPFSNNRVSLENCIVIRKVYCINFISGTRDLHSGLNCNYVSSVHHL